MNISTVNNTVFAAIRKLTKEVGQKLFFGHNMIIIFGEELAKEGVAKYLDFFNRDPELRRRSYILVSKGSKAKEILNTKPDIANFSAEEISSLVESGVVNASVIKVDFHHFISQLSTVGRSSIASVVQLDKAKDTPKVNGVAVFKGDKVVDWFREYYSRGLLFILRQIDSGIIEISCTAKHKKEISIEITESKIKIIPVFINNRPVININIKINSNLGSQECKNSLLTTNQVNKLEKKVSQKIRTKINSVVGKAQSLDVDIFGFGSYFHRQHPEYWAKAKNNWPIIFANLEVNTMIEVEIERSGLTYGPVINK